MNPKGNPQNLRKGGGRKAGVPNVASRGFKEVARLFLESPVYRQSAERRMVSGKAPHLELFFHQHAYGKPQDGGTFTHIHKAYGWQE
jgi:hypothetical protein